MMVGQEVWTHDVYPRCTPKNGSSVRVRMERQQGTKRDKVRILFGYCIHI